MVATCSWSWRPRPSTRPTSLSPTGRAPISRGRQTLPDGTRRSARHDDRGGEGSVMTSRRTRAVALAAVLLAGARTLGQATPVAAPAAQAPSPAIDLSGYWTPALHEDSTERGAGPEMADYSGLPLNEAGRLFALSYDPSRLTLRHHQCDGYVARSEERRVGKQC